MRIHNDTSSQYIRSLASAIYKDPESLNHWLCLHIHSKHTAHVDIATIIEVKEVNKNLGCDVVRCPDNDLLLISSELNQETLHCIAASLTENIDPAEVEFTMYNLFSDWRTVRALLLAKCKDGSVAAPEALEVQNFDDVAMMADSFVEMKRLRGVRHTPYVLVVEDDPLTRRIVANAFKDNYALVTAQTAHDAVAQYLLCAPDIVFLDIGLPDVSGFAVLNQIVSLDPDAYVVMFSGNSYLDNVTKALNGGAAGFIAKPFKRDKLTHYIEQSAVHHRRAFG